MSKENLHALCFCLPETSTQLILAFNAMDIKHILENSNVNEEIFNFLNSHNAHKYRLLARFFNGKLAGLGESIKFNVLYAKCFHPIPPFLANWAKENGVKGIYLQDNSFHLLLNPPQIGEVHE